MSLVKDGNVTVPVFWSMRSPYCYISLDRCLAYQKKYNLTLDLCPVWPIAIRNSAGESRISRAVSTTIETPRARLLAPSRTTRGVGCWGFRGFGVRGLREFGDLTRPFHAVSSCPCPCPIPFLYR